MNSKNKHQISAATSRLDRRMMLRKEKGREWWEMDERTVGPTLIKSLAGGEGSIEGSTHSEK
jgi:hypothetical protein